MKWAYVLVAAGIIACGVLMRWSKEGWAFAIVLAGLYAVEELWNMRIKRLTQRVERLEQRVHDLEARSK